MTRKTTAWSLVTSQPSQTANDIGRGLAAPLFLEIPMKFRYLGTDTEPEAVTIRGVEFPKGKAVAVDDIDLAIKLEALPYFREVKARKNADA